MNISESSNVTPLRTVFRLRGDIAYIQAQYTLPIYITSILRISREVYRLGNLSSLSKKPFQLINNQSNTTPFWWTAAVMGYGRYIVYSAYLQSRRRQGANGSLTTRPRTLYKNLNFLHAIVSRFIRSVLACQPGSIWCAFPRSSKPSATCAGRGNRIAVRISDRNDGVVKRGKNVRNATWNHLLSFPTRL
jgi:hypothetical protein